MVRAALAALLIAAPVAATPPGSPPPKVSGARTAPPPAWIELPADAPSRWLAYGSFCWKTTCADFLPPQMRPDLPRARVRVGSTVRFHLGFKPSKLRLELVGGARTWTLRPARVSSWRVARRGVVSLTAHAPGGDASYAIRLG
jgi:hypothetical protein